MTGAYRKRSQEEIEISRRIDAMMEFKRKSFIHKFFLRLQGKAIDSVVVKNGNFTYVFE